MSKIRGQSAVSKFLIALWAMGTMILLFVVLLLVRQMLSEGQDPLGAFRQPGEAEVAGGAVARPATELGSRDVALYFASKDASGLAPLTIKVPFTDSTVDNCRAVLEQLIAGPPETLTAIIPDNTQIRGLYLLDDGELVVDLSREVISFHREFKSASMEALMAYGIVNTLSQPTLQSRADPEVRSVRILLEGSVAVDNFPAHMDWSAPLTPDARWVQAQRERADNG